MSSQKLVITNRDRVLRAWQNSTELVRDFKNYSTEIGEDAGVSQMFADFAVDEGVHAAKLLEVLKTYEAR